MNNNESKLKKFITLFINNFKSSAFVIFYFLILYTASVIFVGRMSPNYVIITTVMTALFKNQYEKVHSFKSIVSLFLFQYLMILLAFIARFNIYTCIILNLITPFIIVVAKTSQYNRLGYFDYIMAFTYFQIIPRNFDVTHFDINFIYIVLIGTGLFIILKLISDRIKPKNDSYELEREGLDLLAQILGDKNKEKELELTKISKKIIYNLAIDNKDQKTKKITREKYLYSIFFEKYIHINKVDENQLHDIDLKYQIEELQKFFNKVSVLNLENIETLKAIYLELTEIMSLISQNPFLRQNYLPWLKMYQDILKMKINISINADVKTYDTPFIEKIKLQIKDNLRYNSYTFRFALQMSLTVLIGCMISNFANINRGLWIGITMFLFLRPTIAESRTRMMNRIIGTLLGSIIVSFIYSFNINDYKIETILIAGIVGCFTFSLKAGTVFHTIMVTIFSLVLTAIRSDSGPYIEPNELIYLRITYTIFSALVVILINTCIFPTTVKSDYKYNNAMLFDILEQYLKLINASIYRPITNFEIKDLKIKYIQISEILLELNIKEQNKNELNYQIQKYNELVFCSEQIILNIGYTKLNMKEKDMIYQFNKYVMKSLRNIEKKKKFELKVVETKINNHNINNYLLRYQTELNNLALFRENINRS